MKIFIIFGVIFLSLIGICIKSDLEKNRNLKEKYNYCIYIDKGKDLYDTIWANEDDFEIIDGVIYFKNDSIIKSATSYRIELTR